MQVIIKAENTSRNLKSYHEAFINPRIIKGNSDFRSSLFLARFLDSLLSRIHRPLSFRLIGHFFQGLLICSLGKLHYLTVLRLYRAKKKGRL